MRVSQKRESERTRHADVPVLDVRVDLDSLRLDHSDRLVLLEHERGHLFQRKHEGMSVLLPRRSRRVVVTHVLHHLRELRDRLLDFAQILVTRLDFGEGSASALSTRRDEL